MSTCWATTVLSSLACPRPSYKWNYIVCTVPGFFHSKYYLWDASELSTVDPWTTWGLGAPTPHTVKLLAPPKLKLSLSIRGTLVPGPPWIFKPTDAQVPYTCDVDQCIQLALYIHRLPTHQNYSYLLKKIHVSVDLHAVQTHIVQESTIYQYLLFLPSSLQSHDW